MGTGGWAVSSSQIVWWFAETWTMQEIRSVWPCLTKPAQRYIVLDASFLSTLWTLLLGGAKAKPE